MKPHAGDSSDQEKEMPAEFDKQDFASLHYRTPHGSHVEIAVMRADNELLLHWARHTGDDASAAPVHSVSIPQGKYFMDSESGADAYNREKLPELMDKFTAGLDHVFQVQRARLGVWLPVPLRQTCTQQHLDRAASSCMHALRSYKQSRAGALSREVLSSHAGISVHTRSWSAIGHGTDIYLYQHRLCV